MIHINDIKKIILKLEKKLKKSNNFVDNGDDKYKKNIKKLCNKNNDIDITSLFQYHNFKTIINLTDIKKKIDDVKSYNIKTDDVKSYNIKTDDVKIDDKKNNCNIDDDCLEKIRYLTNIILDIEKKINNIIK